MRRDQEILALAAEAGEILLRSGAEIFRVQETAERILASFGIKDFQVYVLSSSLFITFNELGEFPCHTVRSVTHRSINLIRICEVNAISREIAEGGPAQDISVFRKKIAACEAMTGQPKHVRVIAGSIGCAGFCYLNGGSLSDALNASLAAMAVQVAIIALSRRPMNKYIERILLAAMGSLICSVFTFFGLGQSADSAIVGVIMPLVPGVLFTSAIRDFFNSDHLSGIINMVDSLLIGASIAVGVGAMLFIVNHLPWGI